MAGHGHCCNHSAEEEPSPELGIQYSLYTKIDIENLECLNEVVEDSGKDVFKPWEKRLDMEKFVDSDVDEELLFNIPFTGNVKLKGIIIIGGEEGSHPSKMRLAINVSCAAAFGGKNDSVILCIAVLQKFKNRPHLTFSDSEAEADQEFELHPDPTGTVEYSTKVVKFSSVHNLSIHFPKNFGAENTRVYYIGLRGEFTEARRQEVMICSYESAPNPADHKIQTFNPLTQHIH